MLSARAMAASASGYLSSLNLGKTVGDDPENVEINHRRLAEALGVRRDHFTTTWQVHSHRVLAATKEHRGTLIDQADGIITNEVDLPLTQRFGDCTPILIYDPTHHAVGLAHAGWRGTVAGMASSLVQAMVVHYGSDPAELAAVVGPAIGPCCYEVGDEVVDAVRQAFPDTAPVLRAPRGSSFEDHSGVEAGEPNPGSNGHASRLHFDLWEANRWQLAQAGVRQIEVAGVCTSCRRDLFFSHRGDHGRTGRFGAVVMLTR